MFDIPCSNLNNHRLNLLVLSFTVHDTNSGSYPTRTTYKPIKKLLKPTTQPPPITITVAFRPTSMFISKI